ncbi:hypothetical protein PL145_00790 [Dickeya fangzhongdai]|nr:hypothetical protein [Dickeya fangzhongdai]WKV50859.1 hypothetical protein PL145_00790 [Dickeya fangzhongdai]
MDGSGQRAGVVFRADAGVNGESEPSSLAAPAGVPAPTVAGELTASGDLLLTHGPRVWRVRGWQKNTVQEVMKVNVQVRDESTGALYVDSLDLYSSRQRQGYVSAAAAELGCEASVIKRECGRVLLMLEQQQECQRQAAEQADATAAVTVSAEDEAAALELLTSPDLAARIVDDLAACGVVGESTNLLTGYLAATSRKLDKPLAVLIQSSSAAGKSSLMDAVLGMMPEEERIQYSAMTGQSLYYLGETSVTAQDTGDSRGRRGQAGGVCAQAAPVGRGTENRQYRQERAERGTGDTGIQGAGAGDADADHHGQRRG